MTNLQPKLLTVRQVAEMLGVSESFVYEHTTGGSTPRIPFVKMGGAVRFQSADVSRFIEEHRAA